MSSEDNKALMASLFAELAKGNGRPLVEALDDHVSWTITGSSSWSGSYAGKKTVLHDHVGPMFARFADTYTNTAHRLVAEGDTVVVLCRGRATARTGKRLDNDYCWVCRLRAGKIIEIIEYVDTAQVDPVLGPKHG